jgi:predicted lipoprotein with Yx(FWY)xxD motif
VGRILLLVLGLAGIDATFAASAPGTPPEVRSNARGDGWTFSDSHGMTLYTFGRDEGTPGKSSCNAECASLWPPLAAPANAKPLGEWTVLAREDQSLQWAFRGRPVYRYKLDTTSGTAFGDGADTQWHIAFKPIATPFEIRLGRTVLGQVLTDSRGHTLYSSKSSCDAECQKTWEPIAAPALANSFGAWTVVTLDSGLRQWAYKGQPLYPAKPRARVAVAGRSWCLSP